MKSLFVSLAFVLIVQNLYAREQQYLNLNIGMRVPRVLGTSTKNMGFPSQPSGYNSAVVHTGQTSNYPGGDNGFDGSLQVYGPIGTTYTVTWSQSYSNPTTFLVNGSNPPIPFLALMGLTYGAPLNTFNMTPPVTRTLAFPSGTDNLYIRGWVGPNTYYSGVYTGSVTFTITY